MRWGQRTLQGPRRSPLLLETGALACASRKRKRLAVASIAWWRTKGRASRQTDSHIGCGARQIPPKNQFALTGTPIKNQRGVSALSKTTRQRRTPTIAPQLDHARVRR
jgi:hypothetical protein